MGLTDPLYYSVHSDFATLSEDRNSTVLHVFKYYHPNEQIETTVVKNELQQFSEKLQPGRWKNYEIASRFPKIIVNQRLPQLQDEQIFLRSETYIPGLYIVRRSVFFILDISRCSRRYREKSGRKNDSKKKEVMDVANENWKEYQQYKRLSFSINYGC